MRLRKIEFAFLAVAVMSVVGFGGWLQREMDRAARARSQRVVSDVEDSRNNCSDAVNRRSGQQDTMWCGTVGRDLTNLTRQVAQLQPRTTDPALRPVSTP
ncbi:hypothetical protein [Paraburkholderia saeva]|jgi:hypothetical protein|uniref:Uncharacterized protein n=1 Tax=Paraburkholderia saeva TaxID=2777537 RepID=A0A9N8S1Z7_9BURK|nr:hypothetical protein [Paraburkholderia saeva]CAG4891335.1 hypothetical protein R70241_01099 [Paraburkholderia saeva]CAG4921693.1 hypothetical protein LMG31841_05118 [Paraburkholderia saeva]CAG4928413.1 hypothetical protein R52603_05696 [Paraburkholderia saeva]